MPIYEYQCQACGHHLEVVQSMSEDSLTQCPSCHKPELSKLISAPAFQLKGTGWYVTDFKDKGKKAGTQAKVKEKEEEKPGKKEESKSQSDNKKKEETKG